jgi:hypothetical protein
MCLETSRFPKCDFMFRVRFIFKLNFVQKCMLKTQCILWKFTDEWNPNTKLRFSLTVNFQEMHCILSIHFWTKVSFNINRTRKMKSHLGKHEVFKHISHGFHSPPLRKEHVKWFPEGRKLWGIHNAKKWMINRQDKETFRSNLQVKITNTRRMMHRAIGYL